MIINADSTDYLLNNADDCSIDLTVTSPPYDSMRSYNDSLIWGSKEWNLLLDQLYRVTVPGGVVVWVVGDSTLKGSETGTSFKQALDAINVGFNLHDTMIYQKSAGNFPQKNRYYQVFEYMFVFSKGKPKTFNPLLVEKTGNPAYSVGCNARGTKRKIKYDPNKKHRVADNVWKVNAHSKNAATDNIAFEHPAIMPEEIAERHILTWSNPGDLVLDPFCGSGTTGKMSIKNARKFIGIEKVESYCNIAKRRISLV